MLIDPKTTPRNDDALRAMKFQLPKLEPDNAQTCPVSFEEVKQYVEVESASFDSSTLTWVRTADIDDVRYWLWEMDDDGDLAFVYVESYQGSTLTSMNSADGLNAEQFLVKEYLTNQFDWSKTFEERMVERRNPEA